MELIKGSTNSPMINYQKGPCLDNYEQTKWTSESSSKQLNMFSKTNINSNVTKYLEVLSTNPKNSGKTNIFMKNSQEDALALLLFFNKQNFPIPRPH